MVCIHDHGQGRQGIALLDFEAAIVETRLDLFHDLVLQLEVWGDVLMLHQVQSSEQLVVIESQDVVGDVFALVPREGVLKDTICVKLWLLHTSTEEPQPLFTQLERVKLVAQVILRHILQKVLKPCAFEVTMDIDPIENHTRVNLGCISCRLWRVVFQKWDLIVVAEHTELAEESRILYRKAAKVLHGSLRLGNFLSALLWLGK